MARARSIGYLSYVVRPLSKRSERCLMISLEFMIRLAGLLDRLLLRGRRRRRQPAELEHQLAAWMAPIPDKAHRQASGLRTALEGAPLVMEPVLVTMRDNLLELMVILKDGLVERRALWALENSPGGREARS